MPERHGEQQPGLCPTAHLHFGEVPDAEVRVLRAQLRVEVHVPALQLPALREGAVQEDLAQGCDTGPPSLATTMSVHVEFIVDPSLYDSADRA